MSAKKNGNVTGKDDGGEPVRSSDFSPGDVVAMRQAALRMTKLQPMSCRLLYSIGWPNEFVVKETFETPEDGPCLFLWPCCLRFIDRKENVFRCKGHPSIYFEKIDFVRLPKKGDKTTSIILPLINEFAAIEYREDEENPQFVARILGQEFGLVGALAKLAKGIAEANKVM